MSIFWQNTFSIKLNCMLEPFLAIFEKFKYLTTATLTSKRNTVPYPRGEYIGRRRCPHMWVYQIQYMHTWYLHCVLQFIVHGCCFRPIIDHFVLSGSWNFWQSGQASFKSETRFWKVFLKLFVKLKNSFSFKPFRLKCPVLVPQ